MRWLFLALTFLVGYLVGSVNLSLVVTKYIGKIDIYKVGSGNAGGTNVARSMGLGWGITVITAEILKSMAFGLIAKYCFPGDLFGWGNVGACFAGVVLVAGCLLGNFFPCFANFKGGKGVSVMGGLLIVLDYRIFLAVLATFLIVLLLFRMVSLSSLICGIVIPVTVGFVYYGQPGWGVMTALIAVMCASVWVRHAGNIKRILTGTERKIKLGKKKKQ
ncbi:MAG: glycerol-3-phosphate acyltransferase [Clostridia bacterium]|nr:glycerol-3-phosphate acyltransferase [Clostridia bacterium]MBQ5743299.1 glycerol-3-phosphate acyltransferase [Clostridia bacterium]